VRFLGSLASGQEAAGLLDELQRAGEAAAAARPLLPPGTEFSGGGCLSEAAAALLRPCEGCSGLADADEALLARVTALRPLSLCWGSWLVAALLFVFGIAPVDGLPKNRHTPVVNITRIWTTIRYFKEKK